MPSPPSASGMVSVPNPCSLSCRSGISGRWRPVSLARSPRAMSSNNGAYCSASASYCAELIVFFLHPDAPIRVWNYATRPVSAGMMPCGLEVVPDRIGDRYVQLERQVAEGYGSGHQLVCTVHGVDMCITRSH